MPQGFQYIDFLLLGFYFLLVCYVGFRFVNNKKGIVEQFLAGKSMGWFVIGSSLFITTVSSEHVIGNPESGYAQGFAAGIFPWGGAMVLLLVAWFFVPFYIKNNIFTTPEFIEKRFGKECRWILSVFSIIVYIITKISITLFAGALLLEALLGWDKYTSSLILVIITGVFSLAGGFRGELYSHVLHCYVLIFCATLVCIVSVQAIGGIEAFSSLPQSHFRVFEPSDHPDYPWTGILLGAPILQIWYWCTDQFMVQRILSAKDIPNARRGALFAGFLMLLPAIILLVPGLVAYVYYGSPGMEGKVYLSLVTDILPTGVKALAVAALLSALISSLAASFNSAATLYTLDIYTKLYPNASEFKIVNIGKIAIILVVNLALVWISFIGYFSEDIIKNLQTIQSYVAPPFTAVFLVGMLWSRANRQGALAVLVTGLLIALTRIGLDFFKKPLQDHPLLEFLFEVNFLHQTFFLFWFMVLLMIIVSLMTSRPQSEQLVGLTYRYRPHLTISENKGKQTDIVLSIILFVSILGIWAFLMIFSGLY